MANTLVVWLKMSNLPAYWRVPWYRRKIRFGFVRANGLKADRAVTYFRWMTKRSLFRYFRTSPEIIRLAVMMYVLYLRLVFQVRFSVSSGSWFSPRSAEPPHNGVGDWCLWKVRCEVARNQRFDIQHEVIQPPSRWDITPFLWTDLSVGC